LEQFCYFGLLIGLKSEFWSFYKPGNFLYARGKRRVNRMNDAIISHCPSCKKKFRKWDTVIVSDLGTIHHVGCFGWDRKYILHEGSVEDIIELLRKDSSILSRNQPQAAVSLSKQLFR
jgi:hypothetical protein